MARRKIACPYTTVRGPHWHRSKAGFRRCKKSALARRPKFKFTKDGAIVSNTSK